MQVMQGSTEECFREFIASYRANNDGSIADLKRELSKVTGAKEGSAEDWIYNVYFPTGERLVFLRFFLEERGYHISELEAMQTEAKALAKLINNAVLSTKNMAEMLGYKDISDFYGILHGKIHLRGKKLEEAIKIIESYGHHINYAGFKEAKDVLWCLENYVSKYGIKKDVVRNIVKELGIPEGTVNGWVYGIFKPIGLNSLMLKYFLEEHGYRVRELEKLAPEIHLLGRAIMKRCLTLEDAAGRLEYGTHTQLLAVLQGREGMGRIRKDKLREMLKEINIPMKVISNENNHNLTPEPESEKKTKGEKKEESPPRNLEESLKRIMVSSEGTFNSSQNNREVVQILTALLKSSMPLVELVASDKFTQEDRMNLRRQVGADDLFKLSNNLYQLNNERTRNMIKGEDRNAE